MAGFRLKEYGITGGPVTLPRVYQSILEARRVAETIIRQLEARPHRRPHTIQIIDVNTGETVSRVTPATGDNPDPFAPECLAGEGGRSGPPDTLPSPGGP